MSAETREAARHPEPLAEFFRRCWERACNGMDVDGSDVQDWGIELGMIVGWTVAP